MFNCLALSLLHRASCIAKLNHWHLPFSFSLLRRRNALRHLSLLLLPLIYFPLMLRGSQPMNLQHSFLFTSSRNRAYFIKYHTSVTSDHPAVHSYLNTRVYAWNMSMCFKREAVVKGKDRGKKLWVRPRIFDSSLMRGAVCPPRPLICWRATVKANVEFVESDESQWKIRLIESRIKYTISAYMWR